METGLLHEYLPPAYVGGRGDPARSSWGGVPCQVQPGGTLLGGTQVGYPPCPDLAGGGYPRRTTKGVVTTRRAVCLLHSHRTFLFGNFSMRGERYYFCMEGST